jgi:uracil DNA glycosylase
MLLLNSTLTVEKGKSNSHAKLWNKFTDKLIDWFSEQNNHCVFLLHLFHCKMGHFTTKKI